jgi:hypothetical protein
LSCVRGMGHLIFALASGCRSSPERLGARRKLGSNIGRGLRSRQIPLRVFLLQWQLVRRHRSACSGPARFLTTS